LHYQTNDHTEANTDDPEEHRRRFEEVEDAINPIEAEADTAQEQTTQKRGEHKSDHGSWESPGTETANNHIHCRQPGEHCRTNEGWEQLEPSGLARNIHLRVLTRVL
jgi:hypothetical protein